MSGSRPFKVIIFDIDNTLIYRLPRPAATLLAFVREKGLSTYPDALQRGERRNFAYYAGGQADKERVLFGEDFFVQSYVAALLGAICSTEDFTPWLGEAVTRLVETPRVESCPDEARDVVRRLHEAGYHLVAVSNRDHDLRPLLGKYGLNPYFTFALSGGRAGIYKPNPEIFRIALRTVGVSPAATLAVGDSYDADVVGAHKVGITPVLLDPFDIFPQVTCKRIRRLEELVSWLVPSP